MRHGGAPLWAFIVGGLFAVAGAWLIVNGLTCQAALAVLPSGSAGTSSLSGICGTYEAGGVALLVVGVTIPILALLVSLRGRGSRSGRRVGR